MRSEAASQAVVQLPRRRRWVARGNDRLASSRGGLRRDVVILAAAWSLIHLCCASIAWAQKVPALGYVFPPAVSIGQPNDVQLGVFDYTPDLQWFVHDPRVQLHVLGPAGDYHVPPPPYWFGARASMPAPPIPREVPAKLTLDPATPAGLIRWQIANANGSSGTGVFYASRSLEIVEARSRDFPQRISALPVAVSGR